MTAGVGKHLRGVGLYSFVICSGKYRPCLMLSLWWSIVPYVTIYMFVAEHIWASACDFQQCGILTCVDTDKPVQHPVNSKWCLVRSLTVQEYSSDSQRLWSDCAYAQAGLSLCWSHIPYCWKSHVLAQLCLSQNIYVCLLFLGLLF